MTQSPLPLQIKKFKGGTKTYVYEAHSAFLGEVDDLTELILDLFPHHSSDEMIEQLRDKYDTDMVRTYIFDVVNFVQDRDIPLCSCSESDQFNAICNLWLNISHTCNLNCRYCYADGGNYGMKEEIMSADTAKRCIDYWFSIANAKLNPTVIFFGGEPHCNKDVLIYAVSYINEICAQRNVHPTYYITTNGTIFTDDLIKLYVDNNITPQISVDGFKEIHDKYRPFNSGKGSYDTIIENLHKIIPHFKVIQTSITVTKENIGDIKDIVTHLWNEGFTNVNINPIITTDSTLALTEQDIELLSPQLDVLADFTYTHIFHKKPGILSNVVKIADSLYHRPKGARCSLESRSSLVFVPDGTIYKCNQFFSDDQFRCGHIENGLDHSKQATDIMDPLDQTVCSDCWVKNICGGGCAKDNFVFSNDVNTPNPVICKLMCTIVEKGIDLYIKLYEEQPWYFDMVEQNAERHGVEFL